MSTQPHQRVSASVAAPRRVPRFTLDHLWVLGTLVLIWLFVSLLPLPPNDLWWHMAAGRATLADGAIIHTNRWSYTLPYDAPYVYQSWLSEIALYGLWRVGDVPMLALGRMVAIVLSYGLMAWHALRRTSDGRATALALLLAVLAGWDNWTLRPQTLALVPAAAFVVVLGEYLDGRAAARWLAALPLLMLVWVNMHGSFVLGVGLVGLAWLGTLLAQLRPKSRAPSTKHQAPSTEASTITTQDTKLLPLTIAVGATLLATLVNPLGIGIIGYVRGLVGNTNVQRYIIEWQPPHINANPATSTFWFFVLLLLLPLLTVRASRRPTLVQVLWYCGLAWLALSAVRNMMWFGLLLMPLIAEQVALRLRARSTTYLPAPVTLMYGVVLGALAIAVLPWFSLTHDLTDPQPATGSSESYDSLVSDTTPIVATEWLAQHPINGRFWTDMTYTNYTIWQLPNEQIFTDMRIELYPETVWKDYFAISAGNDRSVGRLDTWHITHVMLDVQWQRSLYQLLGHTPGWCEQFKSGRAVILARCAAGESAAQP